MRIGLAVTSLLLLVAVVLSLRLGRENKRSHAYRRARVAHWYAICAAFCGFAALAGDSQLIELALIWMALTMGIAEGLTRYHSRRIQAHADQYDRRLCPQCLYPLPDGSTVRCPECGCQTTIADARAFWGDSEL